MTRQPRTRPTLEEVAAVAGVGRGTASRVINGSSKVSEKARQAVEGAIAELGYVPNRAARTLVTQRTDAVALVIAESEERVFGEPFFAGVVRGVGTALSDARLQLVLLLAHAAQRNGRLDDYLTRQHVDGVLLLSLHDDDALPDRIRARGLPVVLGGRATDHQRGAYVDADNVLGARLAVDHLVHRGRRRIGAILGPPDMVVGPDPPRGLPGRPGGRRAGGGRLAGGGRRLQPGQRRVRDARPPVAAAGPRRGLLRQRPDGGRRAAGAAGGRTGRAGRRVGGRLRRRTARAVDTPAADHRAPVPGADGSRDGVAAARRHGPPRRAAASPGCSRPAWWSARAPSHPPADPPVQNGRVSVVGEGDPPGQNGRVGVVGRPAGLSPWSPAGGGCGTATTAGSCWPRSASPEWSPWWSRPSSAEGELFLHSQGSSAKHDAGTLLMRVTTT